MMNQGIKYNNPFLQEIYDMVHKKNRNCLIVIVGDTGKGKSYVALRIAHALDPEGFNENTIRERVVAEPKQFIDLVVKKKDKLNNGSVIVFDEAGTGMAARQWHSANNQAIDYILQTFRYQQLIVIFTVPNLSFIDTHARRLFHYYVEALDIDKKNNLNICKIFKLSYNKMKPEEPYKRYFRGLSLNGERIIIETFKLKKVKASIWHEYEKYASEFKGDIGLRAMESVNKPQAEKEKVYDPKKVAEEIILNPNDYIKIWHGRPIVDKDLISINYQIGDRKAVKIKKLVEKELEKKQNTIETLQNSL